MGWYIFFAILLFFALLLSVNVKIRLKFRDKLEAWLVICIFHKRIYPSPKKAKRIKLKNYSPKALEKKKRKEEKKKDYTQSKPDTSKKHRIRDTIGTVKLITKMAAVILNKFRNYLKINIKRLYITIASDDAAKTAVTYGCASQCIAYLLELLSMATNIKQSSTSTNVSVDFSCEETYADIDIIFSIRVWHIILLAITAVKLFLKENVIGRKKAVK